MLNQKGIAFIPMLLWSAILLIGGFVGQDAVKQGYISIDSPYISKETPTPQPTILPTPLPTYKPNPTPIPRTSPQGQVQGVTQTNQTAQKPQGRTGKIIKYKEYCKGGKEISVYEDELITRKALSDGKTYSMTKDDWDCSDRNNVATKQPATTTPNTNQPTPNHPQLITIPCTTVYGLGNAYGNSYQEATNNCKDQQDFANKLKAQSDKSLNDIKSGYENIVNDKFQPAYTPPVLKAEPPPQIKVETTRSCIYWYGAPVCTCKDTLGNSYSC